MFATHLLFGEPDWVGMLIYALLFFGPLVIFAFVVRPIFIKVFRGGSDILTMISPDAQTQADAQPKRQMR